ncbi:hypothetical protein KQX54_017101 [Cotesia glomerata]|uniref:Uncharacterized protein n=1 Tax=Cotesia glomerata TaxID=32391 RepID=A0AAV7HWK2_COTGL|nr:hypothetical protein KQX54_017101 [Cotesia glomerata]
MEESFDKLFLFHLDFLPPPGSLDQFVTKYNPINKIKSILIIRESGWKLPQLIKPVKFEDPTNLKTVLAKDVRGGLTAREIENKQILLSKGRAGHRSIEVRSHHILGYSAFCSPTFGSHLEPPAHLYAFKLEKLLYTDLSGIEDICVSTHTRTQGPLTIIPPSPSDSASTGKSTSRCMCIVEDWDSRDQNGSVFVNEVISDPKEPQETGSW